MADVHAMPLGRVRTRPCRAQGWVAWVWMQWPSRVMPFGQAHNQVRTLLAKPDRHDTLVRLDQARISHFKCERPFTQRTSRRRLESHAARTSQARPQGRAKRQQARQHGRADRQHANRHEPKGTTPQGTGGQAIRPDTEATSAEQAQQRRPRHQRRSGSAGQAAQSGSANHAGTPHSQPGQP